MKKINFTVLILLIIFIFNWSQTSHFDNREVFLNDSDTSGTIICETPNGKILYTIKNNPNDELFIMFNVLEVNQEWFRIETLNYPETISGWIYGSVTAARIGNLDNSMNIYQKPDSNSTIAASWTGMKIIQLVTFKGDWAKVKLTLDNDELVIGWIRSNLLCGNPYTYCN